MRKTRLLHAPLSIWLFFKNINSVSFFAFNSIRPTFTIFFEYNQFDLTDMRDTKLKKSVSICFAFAFVSLLGFESQIKVVDT